MNKKTLVGLVETILTELPFTRDNDEALSEMVLKKVYDSRYGMLTLDEYLIDVANGEAPKMDVIVRLRRKVQEEHITLRGRTWDGRHKKAVEVRDRIRDQHP